MPSLLIASIAGVVITAAGLTATALLIGRDWSDLRTAGWSLMTIALAQAAARTGPVWLAGWRKGRTLGRRITGRVDAAWRPPAYPGRHAWHEPSGPVPPTPLPKPRPLDLY
jgi:hypothetical protein